MKISSAHRPISLAVPQNAGEISDIRCSASRRYFTVMLYMGLINSVPILQGWRVAGRTAHQSVREDYFKILLSNPSNHLSARILYAGPRTLSCSLPPFQRLIQNRGSVFPKS